ncbi:MAG TPA: alginate export family protein [Candidatus Kapabacteria bacterium]|nr:alginate export family protein [Candidatus Kapabacteria bacterium]
MIRNNLACGISGISLRMIWVMLSVGWVVGIFNGILNGILNAEEPANGLSKWQINFSERFRMESWDNAVNLDKNAGDATAYTRNRTSLSLRWLPKGDLEFSVKLTNEFRNYLTPKTNKFKFHEVFVDLLYVKWADVARLPLTFTLGRQNITLGEGFVVMDGSPLDGSRSIYFNAVRADYRFNDKHGLMAFYCYQPEIDDILPIINSQDAPMLEQPEQGFGLYYTGKFNKSSLEIYTLKKDIKGTLKRPIKSDIYSFGARLILPLVPRLSITGEGAYQFGTYGDFDRSAVGGYFHLDYKIDEKIPLVRTLTLGGIYLGGDDPATTEIEGWDPLFSRWPKWSESYIYTLIREHSVAYWSNLNSLYVSLLLDFTERMNLVLTWHHLGANERNLAAFPGGSGNARGDLLIGRLDFIINRYFSGHFLWEHFSPGNFYFKEAARYNWLRFELMYKI